MATLPNPVGYGAKPTASTSVATVNLGKNDAPQIIDRAAGEVEQASLIIKKTNQKQDEIAAADAANKLKQQALLLEQDPENGFLKDKGNAVIGPGFVKSYQDKLNQSAEQLSAGLTSDYAKRVFKDHQEVIGLQYQSTLLQHQSKETLAFNAQTRSNTVSIAMDDISAHPYDDTTYDTNMLQIGKAVVETGKEMGLTGDALANYTKDKAGDIQSKALHSRVSAMLVLNDAEGAQKYFDAHKSEMHLDAQTSVTHALKEVHARSSAESFADDAAGKGLGLQESLDAARVKFASSDPVTREAAVSAVKVRFAEQEAIRATDQKHASDSAWKVITNGGSRSKIAPELWNRLGGEEQRQINDYERASADRAKALAEGKQTKTDWPTYLRLRDYAAKNPEQFVQEDLNKYVPYMAGAQLEQLQDMKDKLSDPTKKHELFSVSQQVGVMVDKLKLSGASNEEKRGMFESAVQAEMTLEQKRQGGKPLDFDQRQKVIDRQAMTLAVPGTLYGTNEKPAYEVRGTAKEAKAKIVVPTDDADAIRKRLKADGLASDDDAVRIWYRSWKGL